MPDDVKAEEKTDETKATPAGPDPEIAALKASLAALNDTVTAALQARTPQPLTQGQQERVSPQLRQALKMRGATDADINYNADVIMPWIEVFAPELAGMVEGRMSGLDERLSAKELEDDGDAYPYAKALRAERRKLVADAKKEGRALSQESAYHTAVSLDITKGEESKVRKAEAATRAESRGTEMGMLSGVGHRTSSSTGRRAPAPDEAKSAADLATMTREQRAEWYKKNDNVPIQ